jgi:hypothetical protein
MSSGFDSLHKILNDETRRKIILLLNDNGCFTYTDLMETMGFVTTGLLNYHLKVLGDLLAKNEKGEYLLSEKGKLAYRLLQEFPEDNNRELRKRQREFWIFAVLSQCIFSSTIFTLFYLGHIDFGRLVLYSAIAGASIILAYFGYRVQTNRRQTSMKEAKRRLIITFTIIGIVMGAITGFAGPILIVLFVRFLGGPDLARVEGGGEIWILVFVLGPIIGGLVGHWLGKKENFQQKLSRLLAYY